jgi:hypothetical protein
LNALRQIDSKSRIASWRKNDTPIAEISGMSRGAVRSGRYAARSTTTASPPLTAMPATRTSGRTTIHGRPSSRPAPLSPSMISTPTNAPTMKISEWAKLMNSSTP